MVDKVDLSPFLWRTMVGAGIDPTRPPVFLPADLVWRRETGPQLVASDGRLVPTDYGHWELNLYGVPEANVPYFGDDPNTLYRIEGTHARYPQGFTFGIKSGPDQGYAYRYDWSPDFNAYVPTGATGLIGGRNSLFDTNAFIRQSNKMALITAAILVGGYFLAPAAGAGAAAGEAGAATATTATTATTTAATAAETAAAADLAGGLLPAYGSTAAYDAAIAAGASTAAAEGAATASAWDWLVGQAQSYAGKFAAQQLAQRIAANTRPGQAPAVANRVAGEYALPDGSRARVNPDGSITILDANGGAQVIGAGGALSTQWIAGVPNALVFGAGIALLGRVLLGLTKRRG